MVASVTPVLGFTETLSDPLGYWDVNGGKASPQLGALIHGTDGHAYIYASAAGVVAASGTRVTITEPAMTFVADVAGVWQTKAATIAIGDRTWLKSFAIAS